MTGGKLLLNDILALGGSESEFKMLSNIPDDEVLDFKVANNNNDKALTLELKKLLSSLDIPSMVEDDQGEDDQGEEEEVEDSSLYNNKRADASVKPISDGRRNALFEFNGTQWHEISSAIDIKNLNLASKNSKSLDKTKKTADLVNNIRRIAEFVAKKEHDFYLASKKSKSSSDFQWLMTVIKSGTQSDKLSALSLALSESFTHNWPYLNDLMSMAGKKSRREANLAVITLKDVFIGGDGPNSANQGILPSTRKLMFFHEQPMFENVVATLVEKKIIDCQGRVLKDLSKAPADALRLVCLWHLEDFLKKSVYQWILIVDGLAKDSVIKVKLNVIRAAWEMLANKPEQERTLLSLLVNKFGDSDRKVASNIVFLLLKLLERHEMMKLSFVKEVEVFYARSGLSDRSKYYSLVFLNQIPFKPDESEVAQYLCKFYFRLFESLISSDDLNHEIIGKMMSAILTGLSRAFPFACPPGSSTEMFDNNLNSLFRAVHMKELSFFASAQSLQILSKVSAVSSNAYSRYLRALYSSLPSSRLSEAPRAFALYLNVIYKSLMECSEVSTFLAIMKRSLQTIATGVVGDDSAFVNAALAAFSEGLKQNSNQAVRTLFKNSVASGFEQKVRMATDFDAESDEEEVFKDVDEEEEEEQAQKDDERNKEESAAGDEKKKQSENHLYDPFGRSPEFARAEMTSPWELALLAHHYHPTTCIFAQTLLKSGVNDNDNSDGYINYPSDPLQDFTISRFLDKFAFRNPKKTVNSSAKDKLKNVMKPLEQRSKVTRQALVFDRSKENAPSSADWKSKYGIDANSEHVPVDELFYAEYYRKLDAANSSSGNDSNSKKKKTKSTEDADVYDEEELSETEVERAIMAGMDDEEFAESEGEDVAFDSDEFAEAMESSDSDSNDEVNEQEEDDDDFSDISQVASDEDESEESEDSDFFSGEDDDEEMEDGNGEENVQMKKKDKKQKKQQGKNPRNLDGALKSVVGESAIGGGVFASIDDYSHLLANDPAFDDPIWSEPQVQQQKRWPADGKKRAGKRPAPSAGAQMKPGTHHQIQRRKRQ